MLSKRFQNDGKSFERLNARQMAAKRLMQSKISDGQYRFENAVCLCENGKSYVVLSEKDRYGLPHRVVMCKNCLTIFATPRFDQATFQDFYTHIYRNLYESVERPIPEFFNSQYQHGVEILQFIAQHVESPVRGKVFEAGCGAGGILKVFAEQGCEAEGCDFEPVYLEYGRQQGLQLQIAALESILEDCTSRYDFFILSHVLEHVLEPIKVLAGLHNVIARNGYLFLEVPNVTPHIGFMSQLQSAHNWYFDSETLRRVLEVSGFSVVASAVPFHLRVLARRSHTRRPMSYLSCAHKAFETKWRAFRRKERVNTFRIPLVRVLELVGLKDGMKNFVEKIRTTKLANA
jgi:SAM-dependent methyltransferase